MGRFFERDVCRIAWAGGVFIWRLLMELFWDLEKMPHEQNCKGKPAFATRCPNNSLTERINQGWDWKFNKQRAQVGKQCTSLKWLNEDMFYPNSRNKK